MAEKQRIVKTHFGILNNKWGSESTKFLATEFDFDQRKKRLLWVASSFFFLASMGKKIARLVEFIALVGRLAHQNNSRTISKICPNEKSKIEKNEQN
jgi:hypothetical protein